MKTQDLLLLGIGVGIGYLAFKRYQQNKPKQDTQTTIEKGNVLPIVEGKPLMQTIKDYGNGLIVNYSKNCNEITHKCPIVSVSQKNGVNTTRWFKDVHGKYYRDNSSPNLDSRPIEITEKQWIDEAISKLPFE
jgi:hypothetical protein